MSSEPPRQDESGSPAPADPPRIHVGVMLAYSPRAEYGELAAFAEGVAETIRPELQRATGAAWFFDLEEPVRLTSDETRRPADFLDEASLRMVEGPFDVVLVVTDVAVASRRHRVVSGLPSPVSRIAVMSTRGLVATPRGRPIRPLDTPNVRLNGAALLLHLLGHLLGLHHSARPGDPMQPYMFDEDRRTIPVFPDPVKQKLHAEARRFPEREIATAGALRALQFHLSAASRHAGLIARSVLRSRALLLPLSLPRLATAAVVPTFILIFSAEIWDAGLTMSNAVAWAYAVVSVLAGTLYLLGAQNLFFPREEKRFFTEHVAVVNVTITIILFLGMVGLFTMIGLIILAIELLMFPQDLMLSWPTLEVPDVTLVDKIRLAAFISSIGVVTGALAGGLDSRAVIRHLALFKDKP